jgi:hypothetical protein
VATLNVIQLSFDSRYDKLWWVDGFLWDDDSVSCTHRPTEIAAFRQLYRQSKLLAKRGVFINLSPLHLRVLRLEHKALTRTPTPDNVNEWISSQLAGVSVLSVNLILDECELVIALRETLGMNAIDIGWELDTEQAGKRAA